MYDIITLLPWCWIFAAECTRDLSMLSKTENSITSVLLKFKQLITELQHSYYNPVSSFIQSMGWLWKYYWLIPLFKVILKLKYPQRLSNMTTFEISTEVLIFCGKGHNLDFSAWLIQCVWSNFKLFWFMSGAEFHNWLLISSIQHVTLLSQTFVRKTCHS